MRRSFSLFLYLLFRRFPPSKAALPSSDVRDPVVWVAAQDERAVRAFLNLADKLDRMGVAVTFLVTAPPIVLKGLKPRAGVVFSDFPPERLRDCKTFLARWKPVIGFWVGAPLHPGLLHVAGRFFIPMVLLNATVEAATQGRSFFHRRAVGHSVRAFQVAYALSYAAGGTCIRLGIPEENVHVLGPLSEGTVTLPCDPDELDRLSAALSHRSVWLAADVPDSEIDAVLAAHDALRKTNRRLLLILNPTDEVDGQTLAVALASRGVRVALRSKGDEITEQTQVYLADRPDELGLWLRLAPITYLGGTFTPKTNCRDPFQAAALGSAVVHGPRTAAHRESFDQMHAMTPSAATLAITPESLSESVRELLSPDVAAAQANAGWELVSRGAELTDQVIEMIVDAVDAAPSCASKAPHA